MQTTGAVTKPVTSATTYQTDNPPSGDQHDKGQCTCRPSDKLTSTKKSSQANSYHTNIQRSTQYSYSQTGNDKAHPISCHSAGDFGHARRTTTTDAIAGTVFDELYLGLAGDDKLIASLEYDTLDGGIGSDVADYSNIGTVVTIKAFGELQKGAFTDKLISIETVIGSSLLGVTVDLNGAIAPATNTTANLASGLININGPSGVLLVNGIPLSFNVSQFENVIGSNFNDIITGNDSDNILDSGAGADILAGGLGNNTYVVDNISDVAIEAAGAGFDLAGLLGSDTLTGGLGIDTFTYNTLADSAFGALNRDAITDFLLATDRLDVSAIDANLSIAGDQAFTFLGSTAIFTNVGQLSYQVSGGNLFLYGNADANFATSEFELQLSGLTSITATNITL